MPLDLERELTELQQLIDQAESLVTKSVGYAGARINLCIQVGDKLKAIRNEVGHGAWYKWLEEHASKIKPEMARRWIKLSDLNAKSDILAQAKSIRHAYQLAGILPEQTDGQASKAPQGVTYLIHVDRLVQSLKGLDVDKLEPDQRAQLATRLQPVVALHQLLLTP